ncbi:maleylpyruvate isomerase family mycothiol-dependent enzyme [Fodinicola acaciae]|uniref:maleylpyruvate isomerase family mycothiol-dependent enzyme n=1 Tax=Fodinicola acaciae TaxID=2681555 RepID=UPI0013D2D30A|nr:maleylpyruvate isomerase family mycothiol-dependent enzyme [Fodinicola acaciae]
MKSDLRSLVGALAAQHDELATLLAPLDESGWSRPTRCEGWSVSDVVLHLSQTDELAVASAADRFAEVSAQMFGDSTASSVDDAADRMVARQRGPAGAEIFQRWQAGTVALRQALLAIDPDSLRRLSWVAGTLSVRTLVATRISECWIHTGDVAAAIGQPLAPTDRLWHIARLAWRTIPYAFGRAGRELTGPVTFELTGPSGEPWTFASDNAVTVVRGTAEDLCNVAGRRALPSEVALRAEGPDAEAVLDLVRTYA